ncbi:MAG: hypothetical protein R2682_00570 [Pyrinomonadaceae bacterium]
MDRRLGLLWKIALLVGISFGVWSPVVGQSQGSLRLGTEILNAEYCAGDRDLDSLRLNLRLTFMNLGNGPIILYKGSDLVSRITVARNVEDLTAKRFEINTSFTWITSATKDCFAGSKPGNCFVVLPPNASYETEATTGFFVVRDDDRQIDGAVSSGEHVLKIEVATWSGSDEIAQGLRERWREYGSLWYQPVISDPLPVKVEKLRKVNRCK